LHEEFEGGFAQFGDAVACCFELGEDGLGGHVVRLTQLGCVCKGELFYQRTSVSFVMYNL
jgi:hypothetical protein